MAPVAAITAHASRVPITSRAAGTALLISARPPLLTSDIQQKSVQNARVRSISRVPRDAAAFGVSTSETASLESDGVKSSPSAAFARASIPPVLGWRSTREPAASMPPATTAIAAKAVRHPAWAISAPTTGPSTRGPNPTPAKSTPEAAPLRLENQGSTEFRTQFAPIPVAKPQHTP